MARPNILDRFRPVGAPGPAGPAGVPAVDDLGPAVELAPVFAALDADVQSARMVVEQALREADRELLHAHELAAAILAQARVEAGVERARAAARVERVASEQDERLLGQADKEARELEEAGTVLLPATVRKVMDRLLSQLVEQP